MSSDIPTTGAPAQKMRTHKTTAPDRWQNSILRVLEEDGGYDTGRVASLVVGERSRKISQGMRKELLEMEASGWVRKLDDLKPVAWCRTPLGTEMLQSGAGVESYRNAENG